MHGNVAGVVPRLVRPVRGGRADRPGRPGRRLRAGRPRLELPPAGAQLASPIEYWRSRRIAPASCPRTPTATPASASCWARCRRRSRCRSSPEPLPEGREADAGPEGRPRPGEAVLRRTGRRTGRTRRSRRTRGGRSSRSHNHFAAVCVCPNGDVLAVWYTCVQRAGPRAAPRPQPAPRRGRQLGAGVALLRRAGRQRPRPRPAQRRQAHLPLLHAVAARLGQCLQLSCATPTTTAPPGRSRTIILSRDDPKAPEPAVLGVRREGRQARPGVRRRPAPGRTADDQRRRRQDVEGRPGRHAQDGRQVRHSPGGRPAGRRADPRFLRGPDPMPVRSPKDLGETWTEGQRRSPASRAARRRRR